MTSAKNILCFILALAPFFSPSPLSGQDTTAVPRRDTWSAVVDLSFSAASGNDRTTLLTSGIRVTHLRTEIFELEWTGNVRYGRSEGREVARNMKSGVELNAIPASTLSPFIMVTGERDPFRRLDLRSGGRMGMKYTFWRAPEGSAYLSVAGLYSYENFMHTEDGPPLDSRENARWSWWFKGSRKLGERLRIENSTTYEPVWNRAGEHFITMVTSINVPMSDQIAVLLSHTYERDSMALPGVRKDDQLLKMGLTLRTRW
jgi:hypothetical protein